MELGLKDRTGSLRIIAMGLVALAAGSILDWLYPTNIPLDHLEHILMLAGVALIAYGGGWIAGVAAAFVPPLVMVDEPYRVPVDVLAILVEYMVVAGLTLAARKRLARFRQSESKLRVLLAAMEDLILIVDSDGHYLEVVPTRKELVRMSANELVGKTIHDIFPAEHAGLLLAEIRRALSEGSRRIDYSVGDGEHCHDFSATISRLTDSTVLWVARDITARKGAESALRQVNLELEQRVEERTHELRNSEERYRGVFEQIEEIIYTLTPDGVLSSFNPAFERILGWPREEWIGKPFLNLVPADCGDAAQKVFASLQRDGSIPLSRLVVLARDGRRVALELTAVEQLVGGTSVGYLGVARDVTEREAAEEKLRQSERQLAQAQRSARLGSFEHDLTTNTMTWSEEMFRILGVTPSGSLPYSALADLVVEEDRPKLEEAERQLLARGNFEWEMRVRLADGSEKALWCTGSVMSNPAQGVLRVVGAAKDVTEWRHAEEMLRESEERFRLVADATNDVIWDWDPVTGKGWRSQAFEHLFGYPAGEAESSLEKFIELLHPDDRDRFASGVREMFEAGQVSFSQEYRLRRADGSYARVLDRGYIVRDEQKRPVRIVGAMMDMTERRQLEDQLEQSKRVNSLGRIAASVAHEFNNVLMGIQPNVEVIRRSSPAGLRNVTDNILHAVRRGKRITDEILRFTRPADPNPECIRVADLFRRWKEDVEPLLGAGIELSFELGSDDIHVLADSSQLWQVLTNLALNGRDAMREGGGKLTVSARLSKSYGSFPFGVVKSPDRFVHFSVRDEGCGIGADQLAHIFEPLFSTKEGGIGLGLAVAYQIVTRHDGHIFVESEVGRGSTFHFFLPATLPMLHQTNPENEPRKERSLRRVVLVEDETAVASGIAMLMEMEGIEVTIAPTGRDAIPAIEGHNPDAVVLDIGLPDMDGVGVYLEIAQRWPTLPVLFSTGHGDSAKLEEYLARPNVGFILKPYDFDALRAALDQLRKAGVTQTA